MTRSLLPLNLRDRWILGLDPRQFLENLRTPLQAFLGSDRELAPIQESEQGLAWNLGGKVLSVKQGEPAVFETNLLPDEERCLLLLHAAVGSVPTGLDPLDQASKDCYDLMLAIHYGRPLSDLTMFFKNMTQWWVRLGVLQSILKTKMRQYFAENILREENLKSLLLGEQGLYNIFDTAVALDYPFEKLIPILVEARQSFKNIIKAALAAGYSLARLFSTLTPFLPKKDSEKNQMIQESLQEISSLYDQDSDLAILAAMYQAGVQTVQAHAQKVDLHLPYREFFPMGHNRCLIFKNQRGQENFGDFSGEFDVGDSEKISAFENKMISLFSSLGLDPNFAKAVILYLPIYAYAELQYFTTLCGKNEEIKCRDFAGGRMFLFEALEDKILKVTESIIHPYLNEEINEAVNIEIHFSYYISQGPEKPEVVYEALPQVMRYSGDRSMFKAIIAQNRINLKADSNPRSGYVHASKSAQEVRIDNFLRTLIDDASGIWALELIKSQAKKIFSTANAITAKGVVLMLVALCQHLRKARGDDDQEVRFREAIQLVMKDAFFLKRMKELPEAAWPRMTAALSDMSEVLEIHPLKAEHPLRIHLEAQRVSVNPASLYAGQVSEGLPQFPTKHRGVIHAS